MSWNKLSFSIISLTERLLSTTNILQRFFYNDFIMHSMLYQMIRNLAMVTTKSRQHVGTVSASVKWPKIPYSFCCKLNRADCIKINNANNQDHRCRFIFDTHDHINFFGFCSLSNILQKSKSHFNRTGPSLTPQYIMVENLTDRDDRPPEIGYVFLFKTLHLTWAVTTPNDTKDA